MLIAMKTAQKSKLPSRCPVCDAGDSPFVRCVRTVEQVFRKDKLKVEAPVMVCTSCKFEILAEGQLDELKRLTEEAYRAKHKLLRPEEIVARRKSMGMTQTQFADYLHVGIASVKRWEKGYVQEPSTDCRIREKTERREWVLRGMRGISAPDWKGFSSVQILIEKMCSQFGNDIWDPAGAPLAAQCFENLSPYWTLERLEQNLCVVFHASERLSDYRKPSVVSEIDHPDLDRTHVWRGGMREIKGGVVSIRNDRVRKSLPCEEEDVYALQFTT